MIFMFIGGQDFICLGSYMNVNFYETSLGNVIRQALYSFQNEFYKSYN